MKIFKKIAAILSATALIGCACALSACGKDSTGVIGGNYKEATSQEVTEATKDIDETKIMGDTSAEDWKFGFDVSAYVDLKMEVPDVLKSSATVDAGYKISLTKSDEALALIPFNMAGSGKFKATTKTTASGESESSTSEATLYNDNANVYIAMDEIQGKLGLADLIELVEGAMGDMGNQIPGAGLPDVEIPELGELGDFDISELTDLGFKTYLDTSNGVKVKIGADAETFKSLMAAAGYTEEQVSFTETTLDIYFAIDKNGAFSGVGVNFNLDLSVKATATSTATVKLKGGFAVKAYKGTVKLPDDLSSYTDLSQGLGNLIGGMMG